MFRIAFVSFVLCSGLIACSGAGPAGDREPEESVFEYQSTAAYVRTTQEYFGVELEARQLGPELLRCYESEAVTGPEDISLVQLELTFVGGRLRPQISQSRSNLSESFTTCVDRVIMTWDFEPEVLDEGQIIPVEFGPVD